MTASPLSSVQTNPEDVSRWQEAQGRDAQRVDSFLQFHLFRFFGGYTMGIIPRETSPRLQPTICASADDFAVAAPSFRTLVPAIAPVFRTVDKVTGMNLSDECFTGFNMAVKHVAAYTDGCLATARILKK